MTINQWGGAPHGGTPKFTTSRRVHKRRPMTMMSPLEHRRRIKSSVIRLLQLHLATRLLLSLFLLTEPASALLARPHRHPHGRTLPIRRMSFDMNPFDDAEALASKLQKLESQSPPCAAPLFPRLCTSEAEEQSFVLQEKALSLSGEDFTVTDEKGGGVVLRLGGLQKIPGANLDSITFKTPSGDEIVSVERRLLAMTTCYDIYERRRGDPRRGEKVAQVEKQLLAFTPTFVYTSFKDGKKSEEEDSLRAEGSFSARRYAVKSVKSGQRVAQVQEALVELSADVNTYVVRVGGGVDAVAVLALAAVIDEDHDESEATKAAAEKQKKEGGGGGMGWPFGFAAAPPQLPQLFQQSQLSPAASALAIERQRRVFLTSGGRAVVATAAAAATATATGVWRPRSAFADGEGVAADVPAAPAAVEAAPAAATTTTTTTTTTTDAAAPAAATTTDPAELPAPVNEFSLAMVDSEAQKARRGRDKALFVEDFFFKFGKIPPPTIGFSPPGGMPFAPVRRRYDGYKKFSPRILAGLEQYRVELGAAVERGDWAAAAELARRSAKGSPGSSVADLPLVMGLSANALVQSENEGTTNANFLCRCYANEARYALDDLRAAALKADAKTAKAAYLVGREYVDAWVSFVNPVILPERVGDPFPFVLAGRRLPSPEAAAAAAAAAASASPSSTATSTEPEACRVAGKYLDCLAARAALEQQGTQQQQQQQ